LLEGIACAKTGLERVSRGRFDEFLEAGQCRGEGEEGAEVVGVALVSDAEPVVAEQAGDRITQRWLPNFWLDSMPLRAMRTAMPRPRTQSAQFLLIVGLVGV
jgi:hypothetical protein